MRLREMGAVSREFVVHLESHVLAVRKYSFAPRYRKHTESILTDSGLSPDDVPVLRTNGVIPAPKLDPAPAVAEQSCSPGIGVVARICTLGDPGSQ